MWCRTLAKQNQTKWQCQGFALFNKVAISILAHSAVKLELGQTFTG